MIRNLLVKKEFQDLDDLTLALLGPETREEDRIQKIKSAINLARENLKLKKEIIQLSVDDPQFLYELKKVLDRLGL